MESAKTKAIFALIMGNIMFGSLGLFTRHFDDLGLNSFSIVFIRSSVSAAVLFIVLVVMFRDRIRVDRRGLLLFLLFSVFKAIADTSYFFALNHMPLALASMLQMTFPYYVLVLTFLIFKESITAKKIAATFIAFIGCIMVTGSVYSDDGSSVEGVILAAASGLFMGLYILGGTACYRRGYDPAMYVLFSSIFSSIMVVPFIDHDLMVSTILDVNELPMILMLGIVASLIPTFLDAWSARYILPTTISVLGMMEIVASAVIGAIAFNEILTPLNLLGMSLIMLSVFVMNVRIYVKSKKYFDENPDKLREIQAERERVRAMYKRGD